MKEQKISFSAISEPRLTSSNAQLENAQQEENPDIVRVTWRLISAVKAWPSNNKGKELCVDYGAFDAQMLKDAVSFINEQKPDFIWVHGTDSRDIAGHIENAWFEESEDIPPGINADIVVHRKYDPKAALGLEEGIIRNGSIGINAFCVPSHPKMSPAQFLKNQGKVVNGEEVRWLPKDFISVSHMAIVPALHGADPHAGIRLLNSLVEEEKMDEQTKEVTLLRNLSQSLGFKIDESSDELPVGIEEKIESKIVELQNKVSDYEKIVEKNRQYESEIAKLEGYVKAENEALTCSQIISRLPQRLALANAGEALLNHQRDEALRFFDMSKFSPDKQELNAHESRIRRRIESSNDLEFLNDMIEEYRVIAENKMGSKRTSEHPVLDNESKVLSIKEQEIIEAVKKLHRR